MKFVSDNSTNLKLLDLGAVHSGSDHGPPIEYPWFMLYALVNVRESLADTY